MRIRILAVGQKMPAWVNEGVAEYSKRLPPEIKLEFVEIPLGARQQGKSGVKAMQQEAAAIQAKLKKGQERIIALDVQGKIWSSETLSTKLADWQMQGGDLALLIGGPDGLSPEVLNLAEERWSLSKLTLPHPLVRVILAEQIYRAWTLLVGHPYHR